MFGVLPKPVRWASVNDVIAKVVAKSEGTEVRARRGKKSSMATRVFQAFESLGPPIADKAEAIFFRRGVLNLRVSDSGWLTEITFLAPEIIGRLNEIVGADKVREIRVRLGNLSTTPTRPPPPRRRKPPALTPDEVQRIEAMGAEIQDPELRALVMKAARWGVGAYRAP